jgi:hypothetical protein
MDVYSSGNWVVAEGNEARFVEEWTSFTEWSHASQPKSGPFVLIRDIQDPRHFLSFAPWADSETVQAWRSDPGFGERLGRCRALCDDFRAGDYELAAKVG